jgi:hypothetical protein
MRLLPIAATQHSYTPMIVYQLQGYTYDCFLADISLTPNIVPHDCTNFCHRHYRRIYRTKPKAAGRRLVAGVPPHPASQRHTAAGDPVGQGPAERLPGD